MVSSRYLHLHGKHVVHPLDGRKLPIITDAELVDMSFGTGAVKITPAHDPNDFATGKRHNLQFLNILTNEGDINTAGGQFAGQPRFKVLLPGSLPQRPPLPMLAVPGNEWQCYWLAQLHCEVSPDIYI